jgi:hypothetical protein
MRRALEQVHIAIDWEENVLPAGKRWSGTSQNSRVEIEQKKDNKGKWQLEVKRGGIGKQLRKDNEKCKTDLTERQATKEAYRLLQKFVNGKA